MSDADTTTEPQGNTSAPMSTTAPPQKQQTNKKKGSNAVAKVSQAEIEKSIYRKTWVERIAMILLVSALIVYFIVLIISMLSNANSTLVEKDENIKEMNVPAIYVEVLGDATSVTLDCTVAVYIDDKKKMGGHIQGTTYTADSGNAEDWETLELTKYNYTGVIFTPPDDLNIKIERTITNHLDVECTDNNVTIFVNFYHSGQYDQYSDDEQDLVEAIAYDALESKMGYETDYDLEWYTVSDELTFASKPAELDGIDGAYDYYEMSLSGVYPLSKAQGDTNSKTGFSCYRKHTEYVYQDSTTFADVVAAVGGMYTSLASIVAWFLVKFLWGYEFKIYTWKLYKWVGFAPYAPKDKKGEGEEGGEEEDAGDDGMDI